MMVRVVSPIETFAMDTGYCTCNKWELACKHRVSFSPPILGIFLLINTCNDKDWPNIHNKALPMTHCFNAEKYDAINLIIQGSYCEILFYYYKMVC